MKNSGPPQGLRPILLFLLVLVGLLFLIYALISAYAASPHARHKVSRLLSQYLQLDVTVGALSVSGKGIEAGNIVVSNPAGFPEREMATAEKVVIEPAWVSLLRGERQFRMIRLSGVRLNLVRDGKGIWNFARLRTVKKGEKPAEEVVIRRLLLTDGAVWLEGRETRDISLNISDFSTKGSIETGMTVEGADAGRNRFTLKGTGRLHPRPSISMTFSAPSASLRSYARFLKPSMPLDMDRGKGNAVLAISINGGDVSVQGTIVADGVAVVIKEKKVPVSVAARFSVEYQRKFEEARITDCRIVINNVVNLRGEGKITGIAHGKKVFASALSIASFDLRDLAENLPPGLLGDFDISGTSQPLVLDIRGDTEKGVTSAAGSFGITGMSLARSGKTIADGVEGNMVLSAAAAGWKVAGIITGVGSGKSMLNRFRLPFDLRLSSRFRLAGLDARNFSARIANVGVTGSAAVHPEYKEPYRVDLFVPKTGLAGLQRLLPEGPVRVSAGTASMEIAAKGKTIRTLKTGGTLTLAAIVGSVGKRELRLEKGSLTASGEGIDGNIPVTGELVVTGGGKLTERKYRGGSPSSSGIAAGACKTAVCDMTV